MGVSGSEHGFVFIDAVVYDVEVVGLDLEKEGYQSIRGFLFLFWFKISGFGGIRADRITRFPGVYI